MSHGTVCGITIGLLDQTERIAHVGSNPVSRSTFGPENGYPELWLWFATGAAKQYLTTSSRVFSNSLHWYCGPGSSVGIATELRAGRTGIESRWGREIPPSRPALGPTQSPEKWYRVFSRGVKCSRGVLLTTHPLLVPRSWKSRAIPLPTLWATPGL